MPLKRRKIAYEVLEIDKGKMRTRFKSSDVEGRFVYNIDYGPQQSGTNSTVNKRMQGLEKQDLMDLKELLNEMLDIIDDIENQSTRELK